MTETMLDRFMRIFDMSDTDKTAYQFLMPHVAIGGEDIEVDYDRERKCWRLTQRLENGNEIEAYGDTQLTAVLGLIAKRWGYEASFSLLPEDQDESADTPEGREDQNRNEEKPVYGLLRRCRRHPMEMGCEASRPDCVVELMPTQPLVAEFVDSDSFDGLLGGDTRPVARIAPAPDYEGDFVTNHDADAEHIASWDPARVFREVEAKRRRIDRLAVVAADGVNYAFEARELARELLEIEAAPYSDRPGYQEAWRP